MRLFRGVQGVSISHVRERRHEVDGSVDGARLADYPVRCRADAGRCGDDSGLYRLCEHDCRRDSMKQRYSRITWSYEEVGEAEEFIEEHDQPRLEEKKKNRGMIELL